MLVEQADQPTGKVITFYSYKGGTGRSMLVANTAWLLASSGYRILLIDWDLEAPGLHRYFKPFLADPELKETDGVIQWVTDYWDAVIDSESTDIDALIREYADPRRYTVSLNTEGFLPQGAGIDLICAGRQNAGYSAAVSNFDYARLYEELQGADFVAASKALLTGPEGYDFVLVDSRTGVSDTAGICTVSLADTLVVCFTYNNQSISGAATVARNAKLQADELRKAASTDIFKAYRLPYSVMGIPSRVDQLDPERLEKRRAYAVSAFAGVLTNESEGGGVEQLISAEIPYHPLYSYEEVLAACMERMEDQRGVLGATQRVVRNLVGNKILEFKPLMEGQQRALRDAFGEGPSSTAATYEASTAWDFFGRHMPDQPSRIAFLDESFALLIQMFNAAAPDDEEHGETQLTRTSILESDLTTDERRVLDRLLRAGVACRRVSHMGERSIEIADDSILPNWIQLKQRLAANITCIRQREAVIGCRKSWIASGRRISQLAKIDDLISDIDTVSERGTWLGNRNLDFVNAVREAKTLARARNELAAERDVALRSQRIGIDKISTIRRINLVVAVLSTLIIAVVVIAAILYLQQQNNVTQSSLLEFEREARRQNDETKRLLLQERAKSDEATQQANKNKAANFLSLGMDMLRKKEWSAANAQFSEAIRLDPSIAEAYFQRAVSVEKSPDADKDEHKALEDYAAFYDLRPSLRGRVALIVRFSRIDQPNEELIVKQLERVLLDAAEATRNMSKNSAAVRLKSILDVAVMARKPLPQSVDTNLRRVITTLDPMVLRAGSERRPVADAGKPTALGQSADADPLARNKSLGNSLQWESTLSGQKATTDTTSDNTTETVGQPVAPSRFLENSSRPTEKMPPMMNSGGLRDSQFDAQNRSSKAFDSAFSPPIPRPIPSLGSPSDSRQGGAGASKK